MCKCKPRDVVVTARNRNFSAFNGYQYAPSDYSAVMCRKCGDIWRTKAKYVAMAPDVTLKDWDAVDRLAQLNPDDVCKRALEAWGVEAQAVVALEELSELQTALCHYLRNRSHNMAEEMADVEIMIKQLKISLDCAADVERWKAEKVRRLDQLLMEVEL